MAVEKECEDVVAKTIDKFKKLNVLSKYNKGTTNIVINIFN